MASRQLRLPIKCNLIGGQLASGKTSFILRLLAAKPKDEVWAVLVNEAGAVGIDQALFSGATTSNADGDGTDGSPTDGTTAIKMLGGGCLCCTLSSVTSAALVQLIRSSKPDRLIIEPSGLAHPKALLKMLKGPHLATALDLQPIVCLVDISTFDSLTNLDAEDNTFMAQVALADVLIGTKADICSQQQHDDFRAWAEALQPKPAKIWVATNTSKLTVDDIGLEMIEQETKKELENDEQISSFFSDSLVLQEKEEDNSSSRNSLPLFKPKERKKVWLSNAPTSEVSSLSEETEVLNSRDPVRKELAVAPGETSTCGWIFNRKDIFDSAKLESFAAAALPNILRLKGIFRVEYDAWVLISIGSGDDRYQNSHYSKNSGSGGAGEGSASKLLQPLSGNYRDSRVEIIVSSEQDALNSSVNKSQLAEALRSRDWNTIETMLVELVRRPPPP